MKPLKLLTNNKKNLVLSDWAVDNVACFLLQLKHGYYAEEKSIVLIGSTIIVLYYY